MNYEETVKYLFEQLPLFSRIGVAAYKEDITNTVRLCNLIGNPQNKIKTIHIAGTNGKGSTSHMLAAILQKSGYRTGLYTSPHLKDFRERIRVNGELISKDFVVSFMHDISENLEDISPSFFELTVAMALEYFCKQSVDIAIIETGLGGRLDSTNVITPELSIITNIGYDHMNILGDTLQKIAFEKGGIIKYNVPVILGEAISETLPVFTAQAAKQSAKLILAEQCFKFVEADITSHTMKVLVNNLNTNVQSRYTLDLNGIYQQKNLITVLTALEALRSMHYVIPEVAVTEALRDVKNITGLHGRWDVIQENPLIVLDVAHNIDGMKQLLQQLFSADYQKLHVIFGIVKDKDAEGILSILPKEAVYYFTKARIPRALPEEELWKKAHLYELHGNHYPNVNVALTAARTNAGEKDIIIICGSVYLVGEVEFD